MLAAKSVRRSLWTSESVALRTAIRKEDRKAAYVRCRVELRRVVSRNASMISWRYGPLRNLRVRGWMTNVDVRVIEYVSASFSGVVSSCGGFLGGIEVQLGPRASDDDNAENRGQRQTQLCARMEASHIPCQCQFAIDG
jgi:hypothetical protein